jgi:hypothetical protein
MRGKGSGNSTSSTLFEQLADHLLHQAGQLGLVHERDLDVELGELGLAVGAQVLVAEAARDLVVAVEAGHHQQLLEQLRRLRQARRTRPVHAARHQIVARALRRGLGQDRRLDVEAPRILPA